MARDFRLVQLIQNIMVQFSGGYYSEVETLTMIRIDQFGSEVYKIFKVKICLNMKSKTDKEDRSSDDIAFLSEIILNFILWQQI